MAVRTRSVSSMLSPLESEEPDAVKVVWIAPRRCSANSNETRVRVESSKKALQIATPLSSSEVQRGVRSLSR